MSDKVADLIHAHRWYFDRASEVAPATLKKEVKNSEIWLVESADFTKEVGRCNNWDVSYVEKAADYILDRLQKATAWGFGVIVVDEPDGFGPDMLMMKLLQKLRELGLGVSVSRVTRHRHCPDVNGQGEECYYDGDSDGGAGEITNIQLTVQVPPFAR